MGKTPVMGGRTGGKPESTSAPTDKIRTAKSKKGGGGVGESMRKAKTLNCAPKKPRRKEGVMGGSEKALEDGTGPPREGISDRSWRKEKHVAIQAGQEVVRQEKGARPLRQRGEGWNDHLSCQKATEASRRYREGEKTRPGGGIFWARRTGETTTQMKLGDLTNSDKKK